MHTLPCLIWLHDSPLCFLCLFLCMFRLPQQTRNSEVCKAPSEERMQRIQTSKMQKCLPAYLLKFACLPHHCSARSNWVQKAVHRDACVYSTINTNRCFATVSSLFLSFHNEFSRLQWPCNSKTQNDRHQASACSYCFANNCETQCRSQCIFLIIYSILCLNCWLLNIMSNVLFMRCIWMPQCFN